MNKRLVQRLRTLFFLPLFVLPLLFASCTLETDGNGDLAGFWHLESVDTLKTGGTLNLSSELRFWAVQGKLLNVSDKNSGASYYYEFKHEGDSLLLPTPYCDDRMNGDPVLTDVERLRPFGINLLNEGFRIESLSSSRMALTSTTLRLGFKKF